ncbi:MAG: hypothetical protein GY847_18900 [Proteobacteria bacterium]|nr:hypothetical protein [Pseudomonadota bacterium]
MPIIWLAFFLSGIAGLSYELTWVRYLTHLFGATTPAVAATVSIFFLGLALGSWIGGKLFDRIEWTLPAYGVLETSIGAAAFCVPWLLNEADDVLNQLLSGGSIIMMLLACTAVLLLPTTLIGATFPAMAATFRKLKKPTSSTGFFYGFNTLGAVCGCILVSFWWMPSYGLRLTNQLLVLINITTATIAWIAHKLTCASLRGSFERPFNKSSDSTESTLPELNLMEQISPDTGSLPPMPLHLEFRPAVAVAGASGFLAIAIEVQWVRALSLSFPGTVYMFAVVLAAYLIGIGFGSLIIGYFYRKRAPKLSVLWWLYLVVALGCLLTYNLIPQLLPWSIKGLSSGWLGSWDSHIGWLGGATLLSMLPATLAMGAALPLLIGLATRGRACAGQIAGRLYSVNTLGGVIGSLAATFWLMPLLGLDQGLMLLSLGYIVLAFILAIYDRASRTLCYGMGILLTLGSILAILDLQPSVNLRKERAQKELLYYEDSPSATISIYEDERGVRTLLSNNQYSLSISNFITVAMQYRLGLIPVLLHPHPNRTLLIGFATGATLAAMAYEKELEKLDCVEIHNLIFETSAYFESINGRIWRDSRVELIVGDGRRFLSRTKKNYDVIVADLYNARNPGVGSLYSHEHFRAASEGLNSGGVFVTWLPLWQINPSEMASIIRTFLGIFPHAEGWVGEWSIDRPILGLIGTSDKSVERDPILLERRLASRTKAMLIKSFPEISVSLPTRNIGRRLLREEDLAELSKEARLNSLDFPVIEFSSPRTFIEDRLEGRSLSVKNLKAIDHVRSLTTTPWQAAID